MSAVPFLRLRELNDRPPAPRGRYVLYWMTCFRRAGWNFALDRAVEWAKELGKPLVVLEALRADYPWASDRLHRFVLEGMADNRRAFARGPAFYYPYVERRVGEGKGLLTTLAGEAAVVVTDDYPSFFIPRLLAAVAPRVPVRLEGVDANGLLPLRAADPVFPTAYAFRRFLQKNLRDHLGAFPKPAPLARSGLPRLEKLPDGIVRRWPAAGEDLLAGSAEALAVLPIDHTVPPGALRGGAGAGLARCREFLDQDQDLGRYAEKRNHPDAAATSRLSPFLHFGHLSSHQVFTELMERARWTPERLARTPSGHRSGWWGVKPGPEAFLDQLVTWRELGFNLAAKREDGEDFESLPPWALATLAKHAGDARPHVYTPEALEAARTHDPLWNAAQRQLVRDGELHNYLRMLWGKKILEWSPSPRRALESLLHLNNKYALDGRDPNSQSGIFWCLGRYDRPWGPERPIFGTIRYMSSDNTARKVRLKEYLRRYGAPDTLLTV